MSEPAFEPEPQPTEATPTTDIVWQNTVDNGAFSVKVFGLEHSPHWGKLEVRAHLNGSIDGELLLTEFVGLSYGAIFGPDVSDVSFWMSHSLEPIDAYIAQHKIGE